MSLSILRCGRLGKLEREVKDSGNWEIKREMECVIETLGEFEGLWAVICSLYSTFKCAFFFHIRDCGFRYPDGGLAQLALR